MDIKKINEFTWMIERSGQMKVPVIIYASEKIIKNIKEDKSLEQARNVASLPGIQIASYVMPDAHQGYGFSIGGVAAFDKEIGIISPGGVGYDINCGVRLLRTDFSAKDLTETKVAVLNELFKDVPAGVGKAGSTRLSQAVLKEVLIKGSEWAIANGYGRKEDLERTEEYGRMKSADPNAVSQKAMSRGLPQLGTLGSGNHFLEIQKVDEILMPEIARRFGVTKKGQIMVMIHCGSRGLGHQVATDYIQQMEEKFGFANLPDRELINAPINSDLGRKYYQAMSCAVNFAFANRQMIMHWTRDVFKRVLGTEEGMELVYDVCHNIAKFEEHEIDGKMIELCIHRKGATRSFGPGRDEVPKIYRDIGQPVIIPGSMGTASYLLVGTDASMKLSFGSTAHGAGRLSSRHEALRNYRGEDVLEELSKKGISVKSTSMKGLAEESPHVYKDIDEVVRVSDKVGLAKAVARLVPIAVMKG